MKNIKFTVLFLLLPLISLFSCQSFGNFSAGFVINLEGDFDQDILINGSLISSYNTKNIKCEAHISLNNNGSINKKIVVLPNIKNEPSKQDIAFYSGAIATRTLLSQYVIVTQKNQNKINQLNAERKKLAGKKQQLHQADAEQQERAKNKIMTYLNQKNKDASNEH